MAKTPYIQFYLGDYIKDTRVLPLNVKGGWVDLILAMWDNEPKGELSGTIDDFSRIMNCSKEEANLVIQTLKQKKIFDYTDFGASGVMKIVSRKQKKMVELSEKRKAAGNQGGNPKLLNQKDKLIPEAENEYENEIRGIVIYDAEKTILDNPIEFERICMATGKQKDLAKDSLRKYHLYLEEKEQYPKTKKAVFAGFEKWLLNEKKNTDGKQRTGTVGKTFIPDRA